MCIVHHTFLCTFPDPIMIRFCNWILHFLNRVDAKLQGRTLSTDLFVLRSMLAVAKGLPRLPPKRESMTELEERSLIIISKQCLFQVISIPVGWMLVECRKIVRLLRSLDIQLNHHRTSRFLPSLTDALSAIQNIRCSIKCNQSLKTEE